MKPKTIETKINSTSNTSTLCIFLSGFSGSMNLPLFIEASDFFNQKNIDTLRVHFCHEPYDDTPHENEFLLEDFSFEKYTDELTNIINHVNKKYEKIIYVGHSFGAIIFMNYIALHNSNDIKDSTTFIMWEPSELPWNIKLLHSIYRYDSKSKKYINKEDGQSISRTFFKELQTVNSISTFKSIQTDTLIICAEGSQDAAGKRYKDTKNKNKVNLNIIKDTNHLFSQKEKSDELFILTYQYLQEKK